MSDNQAKNVLVKSRKGKIPLSVGYLANHLLKLGIREEIAFRHAEQIVQEILSEGKEEITSARVYKYAIEWYERRNKVLADRLRIVAEDFTSVKPFVILLGGVTGVGKSTIAKILGRRLDIRTIVGTDLVREVMRLVLSPFLTPTLHKSSYVAYRSSENIFLPTISPVILGFEEQARKVITGVEATITQAIKENDIIIIEGVHLVPGILKEKLLISEMVIPFQLYLPNREIHLSRLKRREHTMSSRTNYSKYFQEIREIHDYLTIQARNHNIPLINMENDETAVVEIIDNIWKTISKHH